MQQKFRCLVVNHRNANAAAETVKLLTADADIVCSVRTDVVLQPPAADLVVIHAGADTSASLLNLIAQLRGLKDSPPLLVVADRALSHLIGAALRMGASDFALLPLDPIELLTRVRRLLGVLRSSRQRANARWLDPDDPLLFSLNARFNVVLERLPALASAQVNLLIGGENGTGRCAVAQTLARLSGSALIHELDCRRAFSQPSRAWKRANKKISMCSPFVAS